LEGKMKILEKVIVYCENCECKKTQLVASKRNMGNGMIKYQFICGKCQGYNYKYIMEDKNG